MVTVLIT